MARRIVLTMLLLVSALLVTAVAPLGLLIAGREQDSFRMETIMSAQTLAAAAEPSLSNHSSPPVLGRSFVHTRAPSDEVWVFDAADHDRRRGSGGEAFEQDIAAGRVAAQLLEPTQRVRPSVPFRRIGIGQGRFERRSGPVLRHPYRRGEAERGHDEHRAGEHCAEGKSNIRQHAASRAVTDPAWPRRDSPLLMPYLNRPLLAIKSHCRTDEAREGGGAVNTRLPQDECRVRRGQQPAPVRRVARASGNLRESRDL